MSTIGTTLAATAGVVAGMAVSGLVLVLLAALVYDAIDGRCVSGESDCLPPVRRAPDTRSGHDGLLHRQGVHFGGCATGFASADPVTAFNCVAVAPEIV